MSKPPSHQPRPKALATLDALIAQSEAAVEARRRAAERLVAAKGDPSSVVGLLRVAEKRLAQLRESRRVLVEGEAEDEAARMKAKAKAEGARQLRQRRKASSEGVREP